MNQIGMVELDSNASKYIPDDSMSHLKATSDPIYQSYRRKRLEGTTRSRLTTLLSMIFSLSAIGSIGILQFDEYFAFINDRTSYIQSSKGFCRSINLANINIISTTIAGVLLIFYVVLYKRRVFLRDKFKYRNFGLPMMTSMWSKKDRSLYCITYGLIAFNIFTVVRDNLLDNNNTKLLQVKDPSGIASLLIKVITIMLIGVRYYPILVAFRANTFVINISSALYMWIDFVLNIYYYGKCESITNESEDDKEETARRLWYFIGYKVLSAIPFSVFSSFVLITLTYKSIINLFDYILSSRSYLSKLRLQETSKDTFMCSFFNVNDDHEVIYNKYDVDYVMRLLTPSVVVGYSRRQIINDNKLKYAVIEKNIKESKIMKLIRKHIYDWDPSFRFTARFVSTVTVGLVSLYYFFLFLLYEITMTITMIASYLPDDSKLKVEEGQLTINIGDILCSISDSICIPSLQEYGPIPLPIPSKFYNIGFSLKASTLILFILPLFVALFLTLFQVFLFVRETKTFLIELYKGKCEYVSTRLSKESIASSSSHFGGYFVGYLLWGFFLVYVFGVLVGVVIIFMRIFIGDKVFLDILLRCVPIVTVVVVKLVLNFVTTRYIFLVRESQILALNNFRAFNVFLYFNFYYDCFMGAVSAVIRLIKAVLIAILMMPRISYSFFGRHFERIDNAYSCYSSFLHMESSKSLNFESCNINDLFLFQVHTNPIIITFCSILYYADLDEHIRRYRHEKYAMRRELSHDEFLALRKFKGKLEPIGSDENVSLKASKGYNKRIVNKWHLLVMLKQNLSLIKYRKHLIAKSK